MKRRDEKIARLSRKAADVSIKNARKNEESMKILPSDSKKRSASVDTDASSSVGGSVFDRARKGSNSVERAKTALENFSDASLRRAKAAVGGNVRSSNIASPESFGANNCHFDGVAHSGVPVNRLIRVFDDDDIIDPEFSGATSEDDRALLEREKEGRDAEIVSAVRADFEARRTARAELDTRWQLATDFLNGKQYRYVNSRGELCDEDKLFYWQEKKVYNHIAPIIETRLSKLGRVRPTLSVRASGAEESDVETAKLCSKILHGAFENLGVSDVISKATVWSETCGTAFYKIVWNPKKGDVMGVENSDGKLSALRAGDIEIAVVPPYEIYPDNLACQRVEDQKSIIHAKALSVSEIKLRYGVDVEPEEIDVIGSVTSNPHIGKNTVNIGGNASASADIGSRDAVVGDGLDRRKSGNALVIERYERANADMPLGRLTVVCGDKLVYDGDNPCCEEESFIDYVDTLSSGAFVGDGDGGKTEDNGENVDGGAGGEVGENRETAEGVGKGLGAGGSGNKYVFGKEGGRYFFPFIKQTAIELAGSFFGTSIIDRLIPIQKAYNAVKCRKHEFLNRIACGVLAVEDGSCDTEDLEFEGLAPGKILVYRQGSTPPRIMEGGGAPNEFAYEEDRLLAEFITISGVSEVSRTSTAPSNVSSGVALQLLVEQDDTRLSLTAENIRASILDLGKIMLGLYKKYAGEARLMKIAGDGGEVEVFYFGSGDVTSNDVILDTDNEMDQTPAQKKSMILEMFRVGLLSDENGNMTKRTKSKVLEMLGFGSVENGQDMTRLQALRAEKENIRAICQGKAVVMPFDDHEIHIEEHTKFMLGDAFEKMKNQKKELYLQHLMQHKIERVKTQDATFNNG